MKKALLLSVTLAAACTAFAGVPGVVKADASPFKAGPKFKTPNAKFQSPTRAEGDMESFEFSYAGAPYIGYNFTGVTPEKTRVYLGFQMRAEDIKTFAGSQVKGFSVYSPFDDNFTENTITEARFFCSTDLTKEDFSFDFQMSKEAGIRNNIVVDDPYTITGEEKSLFIGYSFIVPKIDNMFYVVTDDVANDPTTCICGLSDTDAMPESFSNTGGSMGALCMSITLAGENLPKYVSFASFPGTICLPIGKASSIPVTLQATSGSPIESVELVYTLGGKVNEYTFEFNPPLNSGVARYLDTNLEFPVQSERLNEEVEFKLTKINGVDNVTEGSVANASIAFVDESEVPVRQTLVEEFTGTWCGWCTRGFAALEYLRANYPDFIVAAYHNDDPMEVTKSYPADISGLPSASLNRGVVCDPYDGTYEYQLPVPIVGNILAANAVPTAWKVEVTHEWESGDVLVAKSKVVNMAGFKNQDYKVAYILVADGLLGKGSEWFQTNYYYNKQPDYVDELNAFCMNGVYGKSKVVGLEFNDVVISADGIHGVEGSIPTSVEAEQELDHSMRFDLSKISSGLNVDKNSLRVIAAVVDKNGDVLNCAKNEVNDYVVDAVEGVIDENLPVEYFNLNGMKVANPTEGIFIRRQGAKSDKVIIR